LDNNINQRVPHLETLAEIFTQEDGEEASVDYRRPDTTPAPVFHAAK
jgi:hypothetical protein